VGESPSLRRADDAPEGLSSPHMASFKVGDRVTLKQPLPGSKDNVGTVVALNADITVTVQWEGPEAPAKPTKFSASALDRAD
jgi:hypothetical protein